MSHDKEMEIIQMNNQKHKAIVLIPRKLGNILSK